MIPEDILSHKSKILTQPQREFYFENGYIVLEKIIPQEWIDRLRVATDEIVERSRSITKSDQVFDLEPGHSADNPRLRRLTSPPDHHPTYWDYASQSILSDIAGDLVGPDVKFHHSKLNFKWAKGGEEVKLHQDISFFPHTNYSPLTIGTYIYDVGDDQGPLAVIPGSHKEKIYNQYNDRDQWVGFIDNKEIDQSELDKMVYLTGPAGSVTIHNCRTVHGSKKNLSDTGRPLLLNVYSSADAFPYTPDPIKSRYYGAITRGKPARWAHLDPRPCLIPPDWSSGYTSIYALQQEEDLAAKS